MTAMLTRMLTALLFVLGIGVLAAWVWDRSDTNDQAALATIHQESQIQPASTESTPQ